MGDTPSSLEEKAAEPRPEEEEDRRPSPTMRFSAADDARAIIDLATALQRATTIAEYRDALESSLRLNHMHMCYTDSLDPVIAPRRHKLGNNHDVGEKIKVDYKRDRLVVDGKLMQACDCNDKMNQEEVGLKITGPRRVHLILQDEVQHSAFVHLASEIRGDVCKVKLIRFIHMVDHFEKYSHNSEEVLKMSLDFLKDWYCDLDGRALVMHLCDGHYPFLPYGNISVHQMIPLRYTALTQLAESVLPRYVENAAESDMRRRPSVHARAVQEQASILSEIARQKAKGLSAEEGATVKQKALQLQKQADKLSHQHTMREAFNLTMNGLDADALSLLSFGCRTRLGADILEVLSCILSLDVHGERIRGSEGMVIRPCGENDPIELTTVGENRVLAETTMTYELCALCGISWYIQAHLVVSVMEDTDKDKKDLGVFSITRVQRRRPREAFSYDSPIQEQISHMTLKTATRFCSETEGRKNTLRDICEFIHDGGDIEPVLAFCDTPDGARQDLRRAVEELFPPPANRDAPAADAPAAAV